MPEGAGLGAARGFEIVGPNEEFADGESVSDDDRAPAKNRPRIETKPATLTRKLVGGKLARRIRARCVKNRLAVTSNAGNDR